MSMGSRSLPPPTSQQLMRWALMRAHGCIACRILAIACECGPTEMHHQTVGGKHGAPRLGHDFTIALGAWHHRGEKSAALFVPDYELSFGPSFAKTPRAFRREFGPDAELLAYQNCLIGWTAEPQRERVRRNGSPTARPSKSFRPATEAKPLRDERSTLEVSRTTQKKRRGSARGTHCQRPTKVIPRGARIV